MMRSAAFAAALLLLPGCTAAGLAGGLLVSAVQTVGDRAVEKTLHADRHAAVLATLDALGRLAIPTRTFSTDGETWTVESESEALDVVVTLSAVTPRLTRVSVRAEGGSIVADRPSGEEILNQIAASLIALSTRPPARRADPASAEALAAIQEELRRLRSRIEQTRPAPAAPLAVSPFSEAASALRGGVYVVPLDAGLPRRDGLALMPPTVSVPTAGVISPQLPSEPSVNEQRAAPLRPAETLSPIQVLSDTSTR
jgi:hypothetical protein